MQKKEALQLAYGKEKTAYFCFDANGRCCWRNEAAEKAFARQPEENFFVLFPWASAEQFPQSGSFSIREPIFQKENLYITVFEEDGKPFYLAGFTETERVKSSGDSALLQQFSQTVREHLNRLFLLLDSLSEKLDHTDEAVASQLYGIQKSALSMLKAAYNWDALRGTKQQNFLSGEETELGGILRELLHSAALLAVEGKLKIQSNIVLENIVVNFDVEILQIAILNFISIALANSTQKGGGTFSLSAEYHNGWVRLILADDVSDDLLLGEISDNWNGDDTIGLGSSYQQQSVTLMREFVSLYKGQIISLPRDRGYRLAVVLPAAEDHSLQSRSDYVYRRAFSKNRFSLVEVMLSDRGQELF